MGFKSVHDFSLFHGLIRTDGVDEREREGEKVSAVIGQESWRTPCFQHPCGAESGKVTIKMFIVLRCLTPLSRSLKRFVFPFIPSGFLLYSWSNPYIWPNAVFHYIHSTPKFREWNHSRVIPMTVELRVHASIDVFDGRRCNP